MKTTKEQRHDWRVIIEGCHDFSKLDASDFVSDVLDDLDEALAAKERAEAERDAYKRAKAENDERFMLERDAAIARAEQAELTSILDAVRAIREAEEKATPGGRSDWYDWELKVQSLLRNNARALCDAVEARYQSDPSIPMTPYDYGYQQGKADGHFEGRRAGLEEAAKKADHVAHFFADKQAGIGALCVADAIRALRGGEHGND